MIKQSIPVLLFFLSVYLTYAQNTQSNALTDEQYYGIDAIPITTNIIREVGAENTSQFQYYVSKAFNLKLLSERRESSIESGQLVRRDQSERDKIFLSENLPGVARTYHAQGRNGYQLNIAFENYDGNPVISFGAYNFGGDEKYYILFLDNSKHVIRYGNDNYIVSYDGDEPPYALIKMKQSSEEMITARRVSGLLLGE